MKKIKIIALIFLLIVILPIVAFYIYVTYKFHAYSENNLEQKTGAKNYSVIHQVHDDSQSYIEAIIPSSNKQQLLAKYKFQDFPINWNGNYITPLVDNNRKNFVYHMEKNHGQYAYTLYCVQKDGNDVIIYECFGD